MLRNLALRHIVVLPVLATSCGGICGNGEQAGISPTRQHVSAESVSVGREVGRGICVNDQVFAEVNAMAPREKGRMSPARPADYVEILESRSYLSASSGSNESTSGLVGTYFDSLGFTGRSVARVDPTVNFNWATGSPDTSIGQDTFSVRWSGFISPRFSERYTFYTTSDDGVRLWIGGQLVVDKWTTGKATTSTGSIELAAATAYPVVLEYFENSGNATASLAWSSRSQPKQIVPSDALATGPVTVPDVASVSAGKGDGTGMLAEYFRGTSLAGTAAISRMVDSIDFNWVGGSPDPAIPNDYFSARWTGQLVAPTTGEYSLHATSDDGVRLWVNGQLVINDWVGRSSTESVGTIRLEGGRKYDLKLEYFERTGSAEMKLRWSGPGFTRAPVPTLRPLNVIEVAAAEATPVSLQGAVNVRTFGAVGDGAADDARAIQNAINEIKRRGGGTLFLPKGTYRLASLNQGFFLNFVFNNTSPIQVVGEEAVLFQDVTMAARYNTPVLCFGSVQENDFSQSDITVRGLRFVSTRTSPEKENGAFDQSNFIQFAGCRNVLVEDCSFKNGYGCGIYFKARDFAIRRNLFVDTLGGCQGIDSVNGLLIDNRFLCSAVACDDQLGVFATAQGRTRNVRFEGNTIDKGYNGYKGAGDPDARTYANCFILGSGVEDIQVLRNRFENSNSETHKATNGGLTLLAPEGEKSYPRRITIEGNLFFNTKRGIFVEGCSDSITVRGNEFEGVEREVFLATAMQSKQSHRNLQILENVIRDCGVSQNALNLISVYNGGTVTVESNAFQGNAAVNHITMLGSPAAYRSLGTVSIKNNLVRAAKNANLNSTFASVWGQNDISVASNRFELSVKSAVIHISGRGDIIEFRGNEYMIGASAYAWIAIDGGATSELLQEEEFLLSPAGERVAKKPVVEFGGDTLRSGMQTTAFLSMRTQ
jgi:parallel beta-helix repeat protein